MSIHRPLLRLPMVPVTICDGFTRLECCALVGAILSSIASLWCLAFALALTFPAHMPRPKPLPPFVACDKIPWTAGPTVEPCLDRFGSLVLQR